MAGSDGNQLDSDSVKIHFDNFTRTTIGKFSAHHGPLWQQRESQISTLCSGHRGF